MGTRFQKLRFHIDFGPEELFDRVLFIMSSVSNLKTTDHSLERITTRDIPSEIIRSLKYFDINDWNLKTAEVRLDTGKFVNSTWEREYEGQRYWITIGLGNVLETIIKKNSEGKGRITTKGPLYNFVKETNKKLQAKALKTIP